MSLLASGSNSVKVWNFDGKACEQTASSSVAVEDILSVRWNHTNQVIAAGTSEGNIHLLQGATGHTLSTLSLRQQGLEIVPARSIAFSSNSRYLASTAGPAVHIWDLKRRSIKVSLPTTAARNTVEALCFTAEGQVALGDASGALRLWDINRSDACEELRRKVGKVGALKCLDVSTVGNIATGYSDGGFALWDPATFTTTVTNDNLHRGAILSLAMSPKNPRIAITAGDDGRINLVDLAMTGAATSSAHIDVGERLMSLSFQENAIYSAVGTHSGSILLYDWRSISKPVVKIPAHSPFPVYSVVFQLPKSRAGPSDGTEGSVSSASFSVSAKPKSPPRPRPEPEPKPPAEMKPRDAVKETVSLTAPTTPAAVAAPPRPPSVTSVVAAPTPSSTKNVAPRDIYLPDKNSREEISDLSLPSTLPTKEAKPTPAPELPSRSAARVDFNSSMKGTLDNTDSSIGQYNTAAKSYLQRRPVTEGSVAVSLNNDDFADLRNQVRAVTGKELNEMYEMIRYDMHREVQSVIREQARQFAIAKEDNARAMEELRAQLAQLLHANAELRAENERLRRIY